MASNYNTRNGRGTLYIIVFRSEMSADRAKPESRPGTDRLFRVLDRARVTIVVT